MQVIAGTGFNRNPRIDSPDRKMPHTWSWSAGVSQELFGQVALSVDYVANASRDQLGVIDINEPVNGVRPGVAVFDPDRDADSRPRPAASASSACCSRRPATSSTATTSRCRSRS